MQGLNDILDQVPSEAQLYAGAKHHDLHAITAPSDGAARAARGGLQFSFEQTAHVRQPSPLQT